MHRCARRGGGDSEPSAKRSNAEARAKVRTDARAGVMGTLNQVQKSQMQRRAQRCAQTCARKGDGDSEPSAKRSNAEARAKMHTDVCAGVMGTLNQVQKGQMQRRAQRCAQTCTRKGDGDSEPSAKRLNAEARAKVRTDACAGVMGTLNQVQKGQMQRHVQRCTQMCAQG